MENIILSSPVSSDMNFSAAIWKFLCFYAVFSIKKCLCRGVCYEILMNQKIATRIGIITTAITLAGMLLWLIVSGSAVSTVKNDITNQMTDAVESRASIINDYVTSAEEYVTAFAL